MRWIFRAARWLVTCCLLLALGCAGEPVPPGPPQPLPALSVEQWRELPVQEKYDEGTFERLRKNDPRLQTDQGWDRFMREVVIPERQQDIPGVPGQ